MAKLRSFDDDGILNVEIVFVAKEVDPTSAAGELAIKEWIVVGTPTDLRDIKVTLLRELNNSLLSSVGPSRGRLVRRYCLNRSSDGWSQGLRDDWATNSAAAGQQDESEILFRTLDMSSWSSRPLKPIRATW